jgi:hypothetical protein
MLHRLRHWFHWQPIVVVSEWRGKSLWIGARCVICGEVTNPDYTRMAMQRCRDDAPLFTAFPPAEDPEETRMVDLFANLAAD